MDFKWWVSLAVTLSPHLVDVAICTFPMMVWILWNHVPPGVRLSKYLGTISSDSANAPSKAARVRGRLTTKQKLCGTFDIYTVLWSSVFQNVSRSLTEKKSEAITVDLISVLDGGSHLIQKACWVVTQRSWRFYRRKLPLSLHVVRALDFSLGKELKVRTRVKNVDHMLQLFREMHTFFCIFTHQTTLGKKHINHIEEDGSRSPLWFVLSTIDGATGELPVVTGAFVVE